MKLGWVERQARASAAPWASVFWLSFFSLDVWLFLSPCFAARPAPFAGLRYVDVECNSQRLPMLLARHSVAPGAASPDKCTLAVCEPDGGTADVAIPDVDGDLVAFVTARCGGFAAGVTADGWLLLWDARVMTGPEGATPYCTIPTPACAAAQVTLSSPRGGAADAWTGRDAKPDVTYIVSPTSLGGPAAGTGAAGGAKRGGLFSRSTKAAASRTTVGGGPPVISAVSSLCIADDGCSVALSWEPVSASGSVSAAAAVDPSSLSIWVWRGRSWRDTHGLWRLSALTVPTGVVASRRAASSASRPGDGVTSRGPPPSGRPFFSTFMCGSGSGSAPGGHVGVVEVSSRAAPALLLPSGDGGGSAAGRDAAAAVALDVLVWTLSLPVLSYNSGDTDGRDVQAALSAVTVALPEVTGEVVATLTAMDPQGTVVAVAVNTVVPAAKSQGTARMHDSPWHCVAVCGLRVSPPPLCLRGTTC